MLFVLTFFWFRKNHDVVIAECTRSESLEAVVREQDSISHSPRKIKWPRDLADENVTQHKLKRMYRWTGLVVYMQN